ncbi:uncharacterized protein [Euwallacea similis]|uniref:uncharacterized protein n=1 Tax=Euwallacea similis TaxID=1736056 RepID=UPI00344BB1C3
MAKALQLIVLLCAVIWRASSQIEPQVEDDKDIFFNSTNYEEAKRQAKENAVQICFKICPNHTQQIKEKLEEFKKCSEKINEDNMTLCDVVKQNLKSCIVPVIDLFESCVSKKARGMPTYALLTTQNLVNYICDSNGAHVLELGNNCLLKKKHPYSRTCIRQLNKELKKYDYDNLPEKNVICLFLDQFQDCFKTHVRNACQDSTTRDAYSGLYDNFLCTKKR